MGSDRGIRWGILLLLCWGCQPKEEIHQLWGEAQGTTYTILYKGPEVKELPGRVEQLLDSIDYSLSIYNPLSFISRLNRFDTLVSPDPMLRNLLMLADTLWKYTGGYFDPSVGAVIKYWGFQADSIYRNLSFDSVMQCVGIENIVIDSNRIYKKRSCVQIDLNAIAQGYSVDLLADLMDRCGIEDYLIELGGEVRSKGQNADAEAWRVGIDKPVSMQEARSIQAVVRLSNMSLATSGNYRKFIEQNGKRIGHAIDPHTGYSTRDSLLSVTVVTKSCAVADALATAFMAMGMKKTLDFIADKDSIGVFLIYACGQDQQLCTYLNSWLADQVEEVP